MQNCSLKLTNAKIFTRHTLLKGGLVIEDSVIKKIAKEPNLPQVATTLDLNGQIVIPGVIDAHVHLRDFELAYKETFQTGTYAAAMGGVTTVLDMPNTKPPTTSSKRLLEKKQEARDNIFTNVGFFSGLPESIEDIGRLAKEKIAGFKIYPHTPISSVDLDDDKLLLEFFKVISSYKLPICIHPDTPKDNQTKKLHTIDEKEQIIDFLRTHDVKSEVQSIKRFCNLARVAKNKLHFCHVTTKQSLASIKEERRLNHNITCEVLPHHLLLSEDDLFTWKSWAKTLPPLRSQTKVRELWKGLRNGDIDILASDHAPHSLAEKSKSFSEAPSGISGVETLVPLMMTEVLNDRLSLDRFVMLTSERPAQIFNLDKHGKIEEGYIANLSVINTQKKRINPDAFYSKAKLSPFKGWEVRAIPSMTIINGQIVMQDGQIEESAKVGKIVP